MKILAVKLADLGDLLLSEPALRSLRLAFPEASIDVLTTPGAAGLLPHFDSRLNAVPFKKALFDTPGPRALASVGTAARLAARLRLTGYDRVVILHHLTTSWGTSKYRVLALGAGAPLIAGLDNGRGDFLTHRAVDLGFGVKHETEYMLDVAVAAGGAPTSGVPRFTINEEPLPFALPSSYIAIAPSAGAFSSARIWPADCFARLSRKLARTGRKVVVVGARDANEAAATIVEATGEGSVMDLTGRTTINQTAAILREAEALITNDSFPAHLGAAAGTRVLAIFGPSNIDAWKPNAPAATTLSFGLPCSPCLYTGYRLGRPEGCPSRTCLGMITPEMALEATLELIGA